MRKNKFIDLELGAKLKKFTLYFSVFAITFGVVSAILNTGGTYAVDSTSCPSGYKFAKNSNSFCCPDNGYDYNYDGSTCYRENLVGCASDEKWNENTFYCTISGVVPGDCPDGWQFGESWCTKDGFANAESCLRAIAAYNLQPTMYNSTLENQIAYCAGDSMSGYWGAFEYNEYMKVISSISCVVKVDPNGGMWTDNNTTAIRDFDCNQSWYFKNLNLTKAGFSIDGGTVVGTGVKLEQYFDYQENGKTIKINWVANSNSDTGDTPSTEPETPENPDVEDTPENPTDPDTPSTETTVTVTLYPQNGSDTATRTCTIKSGEDKCKVTLPTVKKANNTFDGWSTSSRCVGEKKTGSIEVDKDTSYYACFTQDRVNPEPGDDPDDGNISENPGTGNWLLYVAYLVGALALGYTGYYSYKMVKTKNND